MLRCVLAVAGFALTATGVLALSGCIAMILVANSMGPSPRVEFEAHADGRLYAPYVDACYWKGRYDPAQSLCGRMIESRETPEGVEYVHGPYGQCVYSFVVDKNTHLITSWRYVSAPEVCWTDASAK